MWVLQYTMGGGRCSLLMLATHLSKELPYSHPSSSVLGRRTTNQPPSPSAAQGEHSVLNDGTASCASSCTCCGASFTYRRRLLQRDSVPLAVTPQGPVIPWDHGGSPAGSASIIAILQGCCQHSNTAMRSSERPSPSCAPHDAPVSLILTRCIGSSAIAGRGHDTLAVRS